MTGTVSQSSRTRGTMCPLNSAPPTSRNGLSLGIKKCPDMTVLIFDLSKNISLIVLAERQPPMLEGEGYSFRNSLFIFFPWPCDGSLSIEAKLVWFIGYIPSDVNSSTNSSSLCSLGVSVYPHRMLGTPSSRR